MAMRFKNIKYLFENRFIVVFVGKNKEKKDFLKKEICKRFSMKIKEFNLGDMQKPTLKNFYNALGLLKTNSVENREKFIYDNQYYNAIIIYNAHLLENLRRDYRQEALSFLNSIKNSGKKIFMFAENESFAKIVKYSVASNGYMSVKLKD
jgi:hypothetical protein